MANVRLAEVKIELDVPGIYGELYGKAPQWLYGTRAELVDEVVSACLKWVHVGLRIHRGEATEWVTLSNRDMRLSVESERLRLRREVQAVLYKRGITHA